MNSTYSRLKQIYLGIIPMYPLGYVIVNGFRGDQLWTKLYVERSNVQPGEHLKELVEQEVDKMENLRKANYRVSITDSSEPKVYGGLFLTTGAELQFPLRATIDDVESARRFGANLELDMGLSKHRRKIEVASDAGDEMISRLMLSDTAKRFLIQRQLQIANSGQMFCMPVFAWVGLSSIGVAVFSATSMALGPWVGIVAACGFSIGGMSVFWKSFEEHKMIKADEMTICRGEEYAKGAIDYFRSTMKLNRMIRRVLGEEGERTIKTNGDVRNDGVMYSKRLKQAEKALKDFKKLN